MPLVACVQQDLVQDLAAFAAQGTGHCNAPMLASHVLYHSRPASFDTHWWLPTEVTMVPRFQSTFRSQMPDLAVQVAWFWLCQNVQPGSTFSSRAVMKSTA